MDHKEYRLAVIMFTDIVGFSRMMGQDEAGTLKLMDFHDGLVREAVGSFGGKVIKTIGDAFLLEFSNAGNAVRCGIEIQKKLEAYNAEKPAQPLVLRIGVHLGDIYFYENDALGEGINIASRLQSLCKPGRICISQEVYSIVSNKIDTPIKPMGQVSLKNISRSIHAYEVLCNGGAEEEIADTAEDAGSTGLQFQDSGSSLSNRSPENSGAGVQGPGLQEDEIKAIRAEIFGRIKQVGKRISVDEARELVSRKGPLVDAYLETLAASGFLVRQRTENTPGMEGKSQSDSQGAWDSRYQSRDHSGPGSQDRPSSQDLGSEMSDMARKAGRLVREFAEGLGEEIRAGVESSGSRRAERRRREEAEFDFTQVVDQQERNLTKEKTGFKSHLTSFISVNAMLWLIWAFTGGLGAFVWPLIVTLAWGIGLASHVNTIMDKEKEQRVLRAMPKLKLGQWNLLRRLFKNRRGWTGHLVSSLAVSAFLFVLNLITSTDFLWFVFPLAGMGIGIFSHLPAFKSKDQEILAAMAAEGIPVEMLADPGKLKDLQDLRIEAGAGTMGIEAEQYRRRILQQIKGLKGKSPLGSDFPKTLDDYVRQIKVLSLRDHEVSQVLERIDMRGFESEYTRIKAEYEKEENPRLKVEYEKSLEQMDAQRKAHQDISNEQRLLQLRLQNALNGLKRLEMDITRMTSMAGSGKTESQAAIGNKSDELQEYMEDLKHGYDEVEKIEDFTRIDPFEQLMKKAETEQMVQVQEHKTTSSADLLEDPPENKKED